MDSEQPGACRGSGQMTEADQEAGSRRGSGPGNRSRPETEKKYNHKAGSSTEKKGAIFELIDRVGLQLGL